jgi:hypothetical protein
MRARLLRGYSADHASPRRERAFATVDREGFLRALSSEQSCRDEEAGHGFPSRTFAWKGGDLW